jgi:hypothetical protein
MRVNPCIPNSWNGSKIVVIRLPFSDGGPSAVLLFKNLRLWSTWEVTRFATCPPDSLSDRFWSHILFRAELRRDISRNSSVFVHSWWPLLYPRKSCSSFWKTGIWNPSCRYGLWAGPGVQQLHTPLQGLYGGYLLASRGNTILITPSLDLRNSPTSLSPHRSETPVSEGKDVHTYEENLREGSVSYINCSCYWKWSMQSQESWAQGLPRLSGIFTVLCFKLPGDPRILGL